MALIKRNTAYSLNDIVNTKYGIKLKCTTAGTTSTDPLILDGTSPITDGTVVWEVQEESGSGQGLVDYAPNTSYNVGDIVINDNKIYRCTTAHTSTSNFDSSKWTEISASSSSGGGGSSIVSSSGSYTTLWSGSASGNNQSIILSDSYTNYDKIGFVCDTDWTGAKRSYYREFDTAYFSSFISSGSGDDKLSISWGYGSATDYVDFLLTTTSTQINFNANACSIKKVVGIKFGGGLV